MNFKEELKSWNSCRGWRGWCSTKSATFKRHFVYSIKHTGAKAFKLFVEYKGKKYSKTFKAEAIVRTRRRYHVEGVTAWAKTIMPRNPLDLWVFVSNVEVIGG